MTRLGVVRALVGGDLVNGDVELLDGRVTAVGVPTGSGHGTAAPGFVDLQVNGFAGVDLLAAHPSGYARVGEALARTRVTAYQPTFITADPGTTVAALELLAQVVDDTVTGPRILGAHLEGPFLSPRRSGTHPSGRLLEPDQNLVDGFLAAGPVRTVTLAPELPGALELIERLTAREVVVACGHTDADAATAHAAFDRGARAVTHLFNAMRPFSHRDPGVAGAALARADVAVPVIVDRIHLAPEAVMLVWRAAGRRMLLVTDATAAAGMPDGTFQLGEVEVEKRGLEVHRADGTLAGSALTMDAAVRTAVDMGVPVADALYAASTAPARLLGGARCVKASRSARVRTSWCWMTTWRCNVCCVVVRRSHEWRTDARGDGGAARCAASADITSRRGGRAGAPNDPATVARHRAGGAWFVRQRRDARSVPARNYCAGSGGARRSEPADPLRRAPTAGGLPRHRRQSVRRDAGDRVDPPGVAGRGSAHDRDHERGGVPAGTER
jgi:N-acetylglucosamine-6-phosphate deacetylase